MAAKQDIADLQFVLLERPSDTQDATYRHRVRSHVTKTQHRRAREKIKTRHATSSFVAGDGRTARPYLRHGEQEWTADSISDAGTFLAEDLDIAAGLPASGLAKAFSTGAMSMRTFALDDSDNDVGVAVSHLGYSLSTILSCYDFMVAVQGRDFESHYTEIPRGTSKKQFLSFLWQDATLLNLATLMTTRYLLSMRGYPLHSGELWHVLHLRGALLHTINSALCDPVRCLSDQILVAVILFAAYELKYSSVEAYHIHMAGFVRMIDLRGGLAALGRYDPWIEKLIVWHDMNCTKIAGCQPYHLKAKGPSSLKKPSGNADMFYLRNGYKAH